MVEIHHPVKGLEGIQIQKFGDFLHTGTERTLWRLKLRMILRIRTKCPQGSPWFPVAGERQRWKCADLKSILAFVWVSGGCLFNCLCLSSVYAPRYRSAGALCWIMATVLMVDRGHPAQASTAFQEGLGITAVRVGLIVFWASKRLYLSGWSSCGSGRCCWKLTRSYRPSCKEEEVAAARINERL